jgi:hypothetical protein
MAKATFQGLVRSTGGAARETGVTPAPLIMSVVISFNPTLGTATPVRVGTSAVAGLLFTLPAGAVPTTFVSLGGATGGASPTVDIGTVASPDGFFNEADADTKGVITGNNGTISANGGIPAAVVVTGRVGASAAAGGTTTGIFSYTMADDASELN